MSPELIILLAFIVVVAMATALIGAFVGLRLARRSLPDRFRHDQEPTVGDKTPPPPPPPQGQASQGQAPWTEPQGQQPPPQQPAAPPPPQQPKPRPENLALRAYQAILEARGVPAKDQDTQTRDFAKLFEVLREKLGVLGSDDAALNIMIGEAREALLGGDFARATQLLNQVGDQGGGQGKELYGVAARHLKTAAAAKVIAGDLELAQMNYAEAARHYHMALELIPADEEDLVAEYLNKHGTAAYQSGNLFEATKSFEKAVRLLEGTLGAEHPDVATALNNLALLHYTQGNYAAAEPLYERALAIDEKALGEDHPGVATDLNNLALLYKKQGKLAKAEPLLKRALTIKERIFDPGHPSLMTGLKNYAAILRALDRVAEAKSFEARAATLPPKRTAFEAQN